MGMLASLSSTVRCAVVATHDMELVASWATRVIVLDQGRVLLDTDPRSMFSRPEVTGQARLLPPQAARIAQALDLTPTPLTAAELRTCLRTPDIRTQDAQNTQASAYSSGSKETH